MRVIKKKNNGARALPTIAIGGAVPTTEEKAEIKKDLGKKTEKFISENPTKPEIKEVTVESPIKIKSSSFSIDDEYVDMAKHILGIPKTKPTTIVELAKAVISKFSELDSIIKRLSAPRNDMFNRVYSSSECGSQWN